MYDYGAKDIIKVQQLKETDLIGLKQQIVWYMRISKKKTRHRDTVQAKTENVFIKNNNVLHECEMSRSVVFLRERV